MQSNNFKVVKGYTLNQLAKFRVKDTKTSAHSPIMNQNTRVIIKVGDYCRGRSPIWSV